jgi:hypothetical protein
MINGRAWIRLLMSGEPTEEQIAIAQDALGKLDLEVE